MAPTFPVHEPIQNTMKGRFQIDLVHGALQRGFCRLGPLRHLTEGLTAKHRPGLDEAFGSMTKTNWAAFSQDHAFPATPAKNTERFLASTMDLAVSGTSQNMILVIFFRSMVSMAPCSTCCCHIASTPFCDVVSGVFRTP